MPPTFWSGGDALCFVPHTFFGVRHFCTNAYGIHWMIGAIFVKFSQLILMKIIKIVATRCHILRLKCTKFNFGWGFAPGLAVGAYSAPQAPSWSGFKGPTSKGKRGKGGRGERGGIPSTFFLRIYAHRISYVTTDTTSVKGLYTAIRNSS